ncbi:MAG: hypothetical protein Q8861_00260 [Bacteroidota bacterium]|nr:hypothetical protein [Bacteroidota bacterium]
MQTSFKRYCKTMESRNDPSLIEATPKRMGSTHVTVSGYFGRLKMAIDGANL